MNTVILFGSIQGFLLCFYFLAKTKQNKRAFKNFFLFLFSLSFFNLVYALLVMEIREIAGIPISSWPFPYKYLFGVAFYFFIKSQIARNEQVIRKWEYALFLPAVLYGLLRLYWYIMLHTGINENIFLEVYLSGFFLYNEFVYLTFNLTLLYISIRFLKSNSSRIRGLNKAQKNWNWLLKLSYGFLALTVITLLHQLISVIAGLEDDAKFYLIILVVNTIFIYWIGLESLLKSQFLFNEFSLKPNSAVSNEKHLMAEKLDRLIKEDEVFTNQKLKITELANLLETTERELATFIHESFGVSFSNYINLQRVEKVKQLINSEEQKKYTLVALAEIAGFSSKASFNKVFKEVTGQTPSQYRSAGQE